MKKLTCVVLLLLAGRAQAHPGVGIAQDSRGNVFFTDLKQVWKIAPDGEKSVDVPNVHTHELCLDSDDNLYGEHLWYEGDATGKWGHRVWRLKRDGTLSDVIPAREGFLRDYSFVRDAAGHMYWSDRGEKTVIKKTSPDGKTATHATGDLRDVGWMMVQADGTLYLIDSGDLKRVSSDGKVTTVANKLSGLDPAPAAVSRRHYHQGLWTDGDGSVYVAVSEEQLVLKVAPDGKTTVAARSSGTWRPSGGMFDRDGNLWLLESGVNTSSPFRATFEARARRIGRDGKDRVF
jgi:hypothetical protein